MRVPHLLTIVAVASMLGFSTPARAQCAGFTDVPAGGNCPSVTWVKNRSITLGCTSATLYCPSSPVSRLAMALFMKRLGEVFTPRVLDVEQSGGVLNFSGFSYLCTATPFQATGYRQRAIVEGGLSFAASGSGRMELAIVYSNDAPVGSGFTQAINHVFVDFEPGRRIHVATTGVNGTTTLTGTQQVSLRIQRVLGTGNLADWTCSLQASVINDNAP